MTSAPLLYLCARPQQGAAAAEYESFRLATRLEQPQLAAHDLVRSPLPADVFERYSGFVVGGSPFNLTDPDSSKTDVQLRVESDLERVAVEAMSTSSRVAVMFTCYGIGIATRMLGGEVSRAYPEDTGPITVALTPDGERDAIFGGVATQFTTLAAHKEGSRTVPPGAVLLATNEDCPVQAYRAGDRLYATQFHPEPTAHAFTERMAVYRDDGYFAAGDYEAIAARVLAASITEPTRLLRSFAQAFGPTSG